MNKTNLRNPIFWAFLIYPFYFLFQSVIFLMNGSNSSAVKVVLGILWLPVFILYGAFVVLFLSHPIPSDHIIVRFFPIPIGLIGFVQLFFGVLTFIGFLTSASLKVEDTWGIFMNETGINMFLSGSLMFGLSVLQLISNRRSNNLRRMK